MPKLLQVETVKSYGYHRYYVGINAADAEILEKFWKDHGGRDIRIQDLMATIVKNYVNDLRARGYEKAPSRSQGQEG